jgi:type IV pilus assembly protein PilP
MTTPKGKWHTTVGLVAAMLAVPSLPWAQASAPAARPAPAPAPAAAVPGQAAKPAATQPAAEPYSYNPEGRRDPFVSLVSRGVGPASSGKHAEGLSGLTTAEVMLRGVLQSQGTYIALVQGPDGKTYTAHVNDRLVDGTIRSITPQDLVIMQEVNDPLSLIKQREVRKGLRTLDDGKQ